MFVTPFQIILKIQSRRVMNPLRLRNRGNGGANLFFNLNGRIALACFSVIMLTSIMTATAQELPEYRLSDVVVTAGRVPISFSDLARSVIVIGPEEIKDAPVNSVQGLLQYAAGVDLGQRGVDGVQADVGIRGGTYNETLVMIDGVSVNDPQTGHHNLNLPVSLDDVQRIEILKGPGSSIYGADAFSGVINIITKKGGGKALSLESSGGQNGYYDGAIHASYPTGIVSSRISLSKQKSDGYMHNTEFDITDFSYGSSVRAGKGRVNLFFGYNDKKFGANGFYSVLFPNQWEHTTTKLLSIGGEFGSASFSLSPKIYWRRNDDNYLLDYVRPSVYQNIHQTNIYGAEVQASLVTKFGTTSFGGEYNTDKIKSTNLGDHSRYKRGLFAEQMFSPLKDLTVTANAFAYDYSDIGWRFWPGLDLGYSLSKDLRVYASVGKAFRIPTYTELYYISPATVGNPNLQHEETLNYEAGFNYTKTAFNFKLSLFRKEGKNLIDWVRAADSQPWTAMNIAKLNTDGIEAGVTLDPSYFVKDFPVYRISADYTYLNSDKNIDNLQSLYLLQYLRHQFILTLLNRWWFGIEQSWAVKYESRINYNNYFLVDSQLFKKFDHFKIFLKATNLFNKSYYEISGVPLPGRWITAGIKYNIGT